MFKLILRSFFLSPDLHITYVIFTPSGREKSKWPLTIYPEVYVSTKYTLNVYFYNTDFVKLFHLILEYSDNVSSLFIYNHHHHQRLSFLSHFSVPE